MSSKVAVDEVASIDQVEVVVTFVDGSVVMTSGSTSVDLTGLRPGIYIINALINNETVVSQRVAVN